MEWRRGRGEEWSVRWTEKVGEYEIGKREGGGREGGERRREEENPEKGWKRI